MNSDSEIQLKKILNQFENINMSFMIINENRTTEVLNDLLAKDDLNEIKKHVEIIYQNLQNLKNDKLGLLNIELNGDTIKIDSRYLNQELKQISETKTIERTKYYINRLIKSFSKIRTSKINDINLNRWKEYHDIFTDSLWILDKRDNSGVHSAGYWGNFIPQIPNQLLRRYTKKNEWVLDTFLGSGTTLIESQRLERNGIGIELKKEIAHHAQALIDKEKTMFANNSKTEIIIGDSTSLDLKKELYKLGIDSVQFVIMHPPYWDIIKFSENEKDLSNAKSLDEFINMIGKVIDNVSSVLDKGRFISIVIGDKYSKGELIPLGFHTMQEFLKRNFELKSIIVKNFDETKGKMNAKELWRYRALAGGFYIFKHEYIFLFKKL